MCKGLKMNVLVMDVEGTDGRERGEDQDFERKSALFSMASAEVLIVNLKNGNSVMRRPIKADSAIMHYTKEVIALKAGGKTLQIFDLGQKSKIKSTTMNEDVVFWKWTSETSLGLVTDTGVYHWNIFDPAQIQPTKVFDRNQNLAGCQITSTTLSEPVGRLPPNVVCRSAVLLYSKWRNQCLEEGSRRGYDLRGISFGTCV